MSPLLLTLSILQLLHNRDTFCAFTLEVVNHEGQRLNASYRLIDAVDKLILAGAVRDGRAALCDLDFGFYSLTVTKPGYYAVVIPSLRLMYGRTAPLKVTLSPYPDYELSDFRCWCYYRIKDTEGRPLGGVRVLFRDQELVSDNFGRVQVISPDHKDVVVRFEKEGYHPTEERFDCTKAVQKLTKAYVVLQRLK